MVGADYYQGVLESLYALLESRSTQAYQWSESDHWRQARSPERTEHLEVWIDIGGISGFNRSDVVHAARLVFLSRYVPDSDSLSQARAAAATRDVIEALAIWSRPDGPRALPQRTAIAGREDLVEITIEFALYLPRGA